MLRAGWDELIVPIALLLVDTFGASRLGWLTASNTSAWKRRLQPSRSVNTFRSDRSQFAQAGPRMIPTPALPRAVAGGFENAAVLNQWFGPRRSEGNATGPPT